ncbi:UNVERIFIED_CONTAM: hypothetical protein GTU68_026326 [Idotea baltica]|nr:hypothetical protein [Idotea baltica]
MVLLRTKEVRTVFLSMLIILLILLQKETK